MPTPQRTTDRPVPDRPREDGPAREETPRKIRDLGTARTMLDELDEEYLHELWMVLGLDD